MTFRRIGVGGPVSSSGSGVGPRRIFVNVLSRRDPVIGMSRWCLSMARSCQPTKRRPGPKRGSGIRRNRPLEGGLTRQVVALTDAVGHRIRFGVLPGQTHDLKAVPELRDDLNCETLMGDTAFDADGLLDTVAERGATPIESDTGLRLSSRQSRRPKVSPRVPTRPAQASQQGFT